VRLINDRFPYLDSAKLAAWRVLQEEFRDAHSQHSDLEAWVYINETPLPAGRGSLQFRELASRAASILTAAAVSDGWRDWLDILIAYLLENDPEQEYLSRLPAGHLVFARGETYETHPGHLVEGENYRICHVFKASELCCEWLYREGLNSQILAESRRAKSVCPSVVGSMQGSSKAPIHGPAAPAPVNAMEAAMIQKGWNAPRLAAEVRAVLKRRGMTNLKVDRTTIYRLVTGKTKRPDPQIRSVVEEILELSVERRS
jgi:hypothetical protein